LKICKCCNIDLSLDCFYREKDSIDGRKTVCKICTRIIDKPRRAKYFSDNKEVILDKQKSYYENNKKDILSKQAEYYLNNIDNKKAYDKSYRIKTEQIRREKQSAYYQNNKDTLSERNKEWHRINKALHASYGAKRRALKRNATPWWSETDSIREVYKEARRLTELTGIQFHVDHIIPLTNLVVQGLHVIANLQILPYYENCSKSNKLIEDMVCS
jgi:hypothetical protein